MNVPAESASQHLRWEIKDGAYPPIDTANPVVPIPSAYLVSTGVKALPASEDLVLYKRPAVQRLWDAIERDTVQRSSALSIVGAPGAGKSSAVLVFACGCVDRSKWIVVWLHFVPRDGGLRCVKFDGDTKSTAKCTRRILHRVDKLDSIDNALFGVPVSDPRGVMVFFDGWVGNEPVCVEAFATLKAWSWEKAACRRFVCVTSVTSVATLKHSIQVAECGFKRRMDTIDSDWDDVAACDWDGDDDGEHETFVQFASWTRMENYAAVQHDEVFGAVARMLRTDASTSNMVDSSISLERRRELVDIKYNLAGGSAFLMFAVPSRRVVRILEQALAAVGNVYGILSGAFSTNTLSDVLLARYYDLDDACSTRPRLVSALAARMIGTVAGPPPYCALLEHLAIAPADDDAPVTTPRRDVLNEVEVVYVIAADQPKPSFAVVPRAQFAEQVLAVVFPTAWQLVRLSVNVIWANQVPRGVGW